MNATRAFARLHAENRTISRVGNYELGGLAPEHLDEIAAIRASVVAMFREIVEQGVQAGAFHSADPELTTLVVLSLGIDLSRWYDDERSWDADEVATYVSTAALHIVRAGDDAPARRTSRRTGGKRA